MIFEQAFMALPEFLTGLPYDKFEYEGTLMTAYSMAVLQELNGRNVNNPISCLRSEVSYDLPSNKRSDIHLNLYDLKIMTNELSKYGFYKENWLEAKFFRLNSKGRATQNRTTSTFLILKDLIRLIFFPKEEIIRPEEEIIRLNNIDSISGRYLLHVYEKEPAIHIASSKKNSEKGQNNGNGFIRSWLRHIMTPGKQNISLDDFHLKNEINEFDKILHKELRDIKLSFNVTNFIHEASKENGTFFCCLTRIDDFSVEFSSCKYEREKSKISVTGIDEYKNMQSEIDNLLI